jgi:hypothetical protein
MGQAGENRQNEISRIGLFEHYCQDRAAMTGLPAQNCYDRTARRTEGRGQSEKRKSEHNS